MWIYTNKGMVSVVEHREMKTHLLLRARHPSHIKAFIGTVENIEIFELDDADYRYRALITRIDFQRMMLDSISKITYPDFKESIPKTNEGNIFYNACYKAWHAMNNAFPNEKELSCLKY